MHLGHTPHDQAQQEGTLHGYDLQVAGDTALVMPGHAASAANERLQHSAGFPPAVAGSTNPEKLCS